METKKYLGQIQELERKIQGKLAEIYQLKTMAYSVTISTGKEHVHSSGDKDPMGNAVTRIVDLERKVDKLVDSFVDKRDEIIRQIDQIENPNMYTVLHSRYVLRKTFDQIAEDMNYSRMQINRIHGQALIEFEKRYGKEYLGRN